MAFVSVRQLKHKIRQRLAASSWSFLRWLVDDSPVNSRTTRLRRQLPPTYPHSQHGHFRKRRSITPPPRQRKGQPINSQSQSLLLSQLPTELRQMIWREFVSDMTLHLRQRRREGDYSTNQGLSFAPTRSPTPLSDLHKNDLGAWIFLDKRRLQGKYQTLLYLPRTCRQMCVHSSLIATDSRRLTVSRYSETINMLYNSNMFAISDMYCVEYLHLFLLPQRISQIRTLTIFWELAVTEFLVGIYFTTILSIRPLQTYSTKHWLWCFEYSDTSHEASSWTRTRIQTNSVEQYLEYLRNHGRIAEPRNHFQFNQKRMGWPLWTRYDSSSGPNKGCNYVKTISNQFPFRRRYEPAPVVWRSLSGWESTLRKNQLASHLSSQEWSVLRPPVVN